MSMQDQGKAQEFKIPPIPPSTYKRLVRMLIKSVLEDQKKEKDKVALS